MADKPVAEVEIDDVLVRALLEAQASALPGVAEAPLSLVEEGWDNAIWRLGDSYAVRLPRRALAAPLVLTEQRVLPSIAARLRDVDVAVPVPLLAGRPGSGYPWHWSVVPWIDGVAGLRVPRAERRGWAEPLARALVALHAPAGPGYPANPFRGVPLRERSTHVASRLSTLRSRGALSAESLTALEHVWSTALAAPEWTGPPLWIHGDLHPGNLLSHGAVLTGIIDFGDVTAGDPAYDLGIAWLAFDEWGRGRFRESTDGAYDEATWTRAHGWAAAIAMMLVAHSDDNPTYLALGHECVDELTAARVG